MWSIRGGILMKMFRNSMQDYCDHSHYMQVSSEQIPHLESACEIFCFQIRGAVLDPPPYPPNLTPSPRCPPLFVLRKQRNSVKDRNTTKTSPVIIWKLSRELLPCSRVGGGRWGAEALQGLRKGKWKGFWVRVELNVWREIWKGLIFHKAQSNLNKNLKLRWGFN